MTAAAFQATYTDFRLIKGRKVVQLVFEVPLEGADAAYQALGGMPDPGKSVWCAVARLDTGNKPPVLHKEAGPAGEPGPASRLTRQAAIACKDPMFRKFLMQHGMLFGDSSDNAAVTVRLICDVQSRRDIIPGTPAGDEWENLYGKFIAWRDVPDAA